MTSIFYYSNYCDRSKAILSKIANTKARDEIHFICIDKREKIGPASWHIILETGNRVLLPPQVNRVPALLLLNKGHQVLYGDQILQHLQPVNVARNNDATGGNGEPLAFSLSSDMMGGFGVVSDRFSFLDQSPDEMSAKGNGGMRQLYNYATIDQVDRIEAPTENYTPDKIGQISVEELQRKRDEDVKITNSPLNPDQGRRMQQQQQQQQQQPHNQRDELSFSKEQQYSQYQTMVDQMNKQGSFQMPGKAGGMYHAPPQQTEYSRLYNNANQGPATHYQQSQYLPQHPGQNQYPGMQQQQQQQQQYNPPTIQQQQQYQQHPQSQYSYAPQYDKPQYNSQYQTTTRQSYRSMI